MDTREESERNWLPVPMVPGSLAHNSCRANVYYEARTEIELILEQSL